MGWKAYKTHGSHYSQRGLPDVFCLKNGVTAWMEVKRPGNDPTKIQVHNLKTLAGMNFPVEVVYSAADARRFLEGIPT